MTDTPEPDEIDPRRELWRRGSYEIVGDWLAPASLSVLDALERAGDGSLAGRRVLDVAAGTGTVSIEAARRGAEVVGVDVTDELLEVARQRAADADVDVAFEVGDFDDLDGSLGDAVFDVITSSFGVMFAPDASATLAGLVERVGAGQLIGVTGWDPNGVFMVPDSMIELMPEPPPLPDMSVWTTRIDELAADASCELVSCGVDELLVGFESVEDAADQLERWSGGWGRMLEMFDAFGAGDQARTLFAEHLEGFARSARTGIALEALYYTSVIQAPG